MSDDNKGSDLDIFEGLGKKSGKIPSAAPAAPPPPPASRSSAAMPAARPSAPPAPPAAPTAPSGLNSPVSSPMMGHSAPSAPTAVSAAPVAPTAPTASRPPPPPSGMMKAAAPVAAPTGSKPPPPPGRSSLPKLEAAPLAAVTKPAPTGPTFPSFPANAKGANGSLDMDWDDENEETHVFDRESSKANATLEADLIEEPKDLMPKVLPSAKKTLLGMNGMAAVPPPPPASGGMRAASAPPPPPPPGPNSQRHMLSQPPVPPPPPGSMGGIPAAPQTQRLDEIQQPSTQPLQMPNSQRIPSAPPPAAGMPPYGSVPPMQAAAPISMAPAPSHAPPSMGRQMEATQMVRPQGEGGKTGLLVGVGLIALAAVAGFAVYMAIPKTGRIVVNAADAKGTAVDQVDVYLDGKKQCDTTPCTIDQVTAGEHVVKVGSSGYEAAMKTVVVESRKSQGIDFALVSGSTKAGTGVKASGSQPSVRLYVDGRELGPLPQEVRDLTPGEHKIRLAGSERYSPIERTVTVSKDEVVDLGNQSLRVLKGKVTVQLGTPGAKVFIVTGTERHEVTPIPIALEIDTAKPARLEATKVGFNDYSLPVTFDDGQAEKQITITMDPKGAAPATAAWVPPSQPASQPTQPAQPKEPKEPVTTAPAQPTQPTQPANTGATQGGDAFLTLNSLPASTVLVDGKPVGQTPKVKFSVSAGTHTVTFVNSEQQLKKTMQVTVGAGETKPVIAKLRE